MIRTKTPLSLSRRSLSLGSLGFSKEVPGARDLSLRKPEQVDRHHTASLTLNHVKGMKINGSGTDVAEEEWSPSDMFDWFDEW